MGYRQDAESTAYSVDHKVECLQLAQPMSELTSSPYRLSARTMPTGSPSPRRDVRVLIVDDSGKFRTTARELLEHRGYLVAGEAASVSEALTAIDAHPPDAVLLDVRLGEESGAIVAAHLQARYPAVPVLLVSADPPEAVRHPDGSALGAFGPIRKRELAQIDLTQFWPAPPGRDPAV